MDLVVFYELNLPPPSVKADTGKKVWWLNFGFMIAPGVPYQL